jgi:hypothetical protein
VPAIVCRTLAAACAPEHRACLHEFVRLAYHCLSLVNAGIIEERLFEAADNVAGMEERLAAEIAERFPILPLEFVTELCSAVVAPTPENEFELRVAELASSVGQRAVAETLCHLAADRTRRLLFGRSIV